MTELGHLNRCWVHQDWHATFYVAPKAASSTIIRWCTINDFQPADEHFGWPRYAVIRHPESRWHSAIRHTLDTHKHVPDSLEAVFEEGQIPNQLFWPQHVYVGEPTHTIRLDNATETLTRLFPGCDPTLEHRNPTTERDTNRFRRYWPRFERLYEPDRILYTRGASY